MDLQALEGTWYLQYSNFPMWISGKRIKPIFQYRLGMRKGKKGVHDSVFYTQNGTKHSILGFSVWESENRFKWIGNAWLSLLSSKWQILHKQSDWMLIYFEKTLLTPSGYDVVSKSKEITIEMEREIELFLKQNVFYSLQRISQ